MLATLALGAFAATTMPVPPEASAAYACIKAAAAGDDSVWWDLTTAAATPSGAVEYTPDAGSCFDHGAVATSSSSVTVRSWYRVAGVVRARDAAWHWVWLPGASSLTLMAEQMEEGDGHRDLVQSGHGFELWEGGSLLLTVAGPMSPDGWVLDVATGDVLVTFPDGRAFVVTGITDPHLPQWF